MQKATEAQAAEAIRLAAIHQDKGAMASSAQSCLADARYCFERREYEYAKLRAIDSLAYSVGAFHVDFRAARGH